MMIKSNGDNTKYNDGINSNNSSSSSSSSSLFWKHIIHVFTYSHLHVIH